MESILTNDMLLKNTRSVSRFGPSMLTFSVYFYLDVQVSTGGIKALDGIVGAITLNGQFFITSANADYIPLPPFDDRQVKLRADSRYGDDDPIQWAQPYFPLYSHFAAIPRPNTLVDHLIIWWTPTIGDFSCSPRSGPVAGLGKLCHPRYDNLRTSFTFLEDRVKKYQKSTRPEQNSPILQPSVKWLQQVLDQIFSVQMSFRHMQFVVRDFQRVWLDVWAILDYMEIYKPRMDGHAVPGDGVADTVGTFTTSIRVAQDMFLAGLPCWLIRASKTFDDQKIYAIGQIFHPKDYVVLEPHKFNYPVIFKGPATNEQKYRAMETFARNFLCSQDPFAMSCTPSSLAGASQPSTSSTPASSSATQPSISSTPASSSATQHSTGRDYQGAVRNSARGRGSGRSAKGRGSGKSSVFDMYYNIKSFSKVLINRPVIIRVIYSSRSRTSPLHHCRFLPGLAPWLLSTTIPLV